MQSLESLWKRKQEKWKRNEGEKMEKYEEELLKALKKQGEELEIPESLKPENMEVKLRKKKTRRVSYGKIFAGLATAACAAFVFGGVMKQSMPEATQYAYMRTGQASYSEGLENTKISAAENYDEIYKLLNKKHLKGSALLETEIADGAITEGVIENTTETASADYSSTNLRTEGVDEGDIIKTDGKYLYVLTWAQDGKGKELHILETDKEKLTELSKIEGLSWSTEFYLQKDQLILVASEEVEALSQGVEEIYCVSYNEHQKTNIMLYDLQKKEAPKLISTLSQDGSYETSRIFDGVLYTISRFYPQIESKKERKDYIPMIEDCLLSADCIYLPEIVEDSSYLVMTALSLENTSSFLDKKAILSAGWNYYISQENIYILKNLYSEAEGEKTQIQRYSYEAGKLTANGMVTVVGMVDDSFSIDEANGYLRVLTTQWKNGKSENALYILDENLEQVGSLTGLAKGEQIYSARYFGDIAYFVTYRQIDPLFTVDLSNPENPTIIGELKVTGFSEYLHFYGENKLLGIGRETNAETGEVEGVKLSMFDISNPEQVVEENKLVLKDCFYSEAFYNYKSVVINPEKNIIGFLAEDDYYVISYEEGRGFLEEFTALNATFTANMDYQEVRGSYIGDYFYLLKDKQGIVTYNLKTNKKTGEWKR